MTWRILSLMQHQVEELGETSRLSTVISGSSSEGYANIGLVWAPSSLTFQTEAP